MTANEERMSWVRRTGQDGWPSHSESLWRSLTNRPASSNDNDMFIQAAFQADHLHLCIIPIRNFINYSI